ncbi:zinc-ribbon domain-containing protein [Phocaeicola dorei]|nr:zinc-ribbon domain-containing protein [Phocaeicola dorei]
MALNKCSNCNADVSDKATVCPKCNKPLNNQKRAAMKGIIFFIVLFALCGGVLIYENYFKFGSVDSASKNVQYKTFVCTSSDDGDHKVTFYDNTFTYYIKPSYSNKWVKITDGSYEIKEFRSEKKDKIGIFVRADKVSNLSLLMIDLSDMRFYWADMYIGKAEIE